MEYNWYGWLKGFVKTCELETAYRTIPTPNLIFTHPSSKPFQSGRKDAGLGCIEEPIPAPKVQVNFRTLSGHWRSQLFCDLVTTSHCYVTLDERESFENFVASFVETHTQMKIKDR